MDLAELAANPALAATVPTECVPLLLAQLAGLQSALTARLIDTHEPKSRLMNIKEAAQRLNTSVDWLYHNAEKLPHRR